MPRPLAVTVSQSKDRQVPHAGSGGWRNVPHEVQCWISSWWARAPSNQKALSWVRAGRGRGGRAGAAAGGGTRSGGAGRGASAIGPAGRYLRMRKRMVATRSPRSASAATSSGLGSSGTSASGTAVKSRRVVTKRPVPSPVRLGSEMLLDHRAHQQTVADDQGPAVASARSWWPRPRSGPRGRAGASWNRGPRCPGPLPPHGPASDQLAGPQAAHDPGLEHGGRGDRHRHSRATVPTASET